MLTNFLKELYYEKYSKKSYSISNVDLIVERIFIKKNKGIYIGCLSEPLAKNIRFEFSDYMPSRFGNIFMVGTTTALIEDFLPREEDNKKIVEINKNIQNKPKIIFYPNVVGILSPKV